MISAKNVYDTYTFFKFINKHSGEIMLDKTENIHDK